MIKLFLSADFRSLSQNSSSSESSSSSPSSSSSVFVVEELNAYVSPVLIALNGIVSLWTNLKFQIHDRNPINSYSPNGLTAIVSDFFFQK